MQRPILTYGIISGLIIIVVNTTSLEIGLGQAWLGFLVMFIAFSTIYVAVKQHRDQTLGGVIAFTPALGLGLGIAAIASCVYVAIWEVYLVLTDYSFAEEYSSAIIANQEAAGASAAELASVMAEMEEFRALYANPLLRLPMTFLEIFPVGLLISLVSAAVLRTHGGSTRQT